MFDAEEIRAATFVSHIEIHDTLGSTNDRGAELARDSTIELPALVVARHQTAGKGRGRNKWWSADGALTFSLLLDPTTTGVPPANWPQMSLASAVAVRDALTNELNGFSERAGPSTGPAARRSSPQAGGEDAPARGATTQRLGIKWPNDVMLDGGKICGILIESPGGAAPAKDRLIIGIGINVNNSWRMAPRNFGPNGTALCDVTRRRHELQTMLVRVLQALEERIGQLSRGDSRLPDAWQRLCWLTEQGVDVNASGRWITGVCLGIDRDGTLLVENVNGLHHIRDGSVRVL